MISMSALEKERKDMVGKLAALESELATWKSQCLENCRLLGISGSVEAMLRAEIEELKKLAPRWQSQADGETHWEGCWQDHRHCALAKIENLEASKSALLQNLHEADDEICLYRAETSRLEKNFDALDLKYSSLLYAKGDTGG